MELFAALKLLADETRFKIIQLLLTQDLCVGALAKRLGVSDAAVSQHLQLLRKGGLLKGEKRGYWTHYAVERAAIEQVAEQLKIIANTPAAHKFHCQKLSVRRSDLGGSGKTMCKCNCEQPDKIKETQEKLRQEPHPCENKKNK